MTPLPFETIQHEIRALQNKAEWYEGKIAAVKVIPSLEYDVNNLASLHSQCLRKIAELTLPKMRTAK